MKSQLILASIIMSLSLTRAFSQAPQPPLPKISVAGAAEIKVFPDEAYLRVGVETRHENLEDAKSQNDERISKALAFLKSKDVKGADIQTGFISIEPAYDNNASRIKPVAFVIRRSIEVKLTDIANFEAVLSGLLTTGVNSVHGIEFRTSQLRKHSDAARAMAVRAAREKADALASELGVKRGKVFSINTNESDIGWYGGSSYQNAVQLSAAADQYFLEGTPSVGPISISAKVSVSFLIE